MFYMVLGITRRKISNSATCKAQLQQWI